MLQVTHEWPQLTLTGLFKVLNNTDNHKYELIVKMNFEYMNLHFSADHENEFQVSLEENSTQVRNIRSCNMPEILEAAMEI